jgi:hypothetical protein
VYTLNCRKAKKINSGSNDARVDHRRSCNRLGRRPVPVNHGSSATATIQEDVGMDEQALTLDPANQGPTRDIT